MANCYAKGSRAEVAVARQLRVLSSFYRVHDFPLGSGRGNADHIVIGPTGVFVIETKGNKGEVVIAESGLSVDARPLDRNPLTQVRNAAREVQEHLERCGLAVEKVQPVVCFANARPARSRRLQDVLVTRLDHLCYLISHWKGTHLQQDRAARIFDDLKAHLTLGRADRRPPLRQRSRSRVTRIA